MQPPLSSSLLATMFTEKVRSGIDALDGSWDGLYRGAVYLLYGQARSGRDFFMLHLARTAVEANEASILLSPRRPRELALQASALGFDFEAACRNEQVRLLRIPAALTADVKDETIESALLDLTRFIRKAGPERFFIEDFTPFVRFHDLERMRRALLTFFDALGESEALVVIGLGEPANARSHEVIGFIREQVAGAVHIALPPDANSGTKRLLTLQPMQGSAEAEETFSWDLASLRAHASPSIGDSAAPSPEPVSSETAGGAAPPVLEPELVIPQPPSGPAAPPKTRRNEPAAPPSASPEQKEPEAQHASIYFFDPYRPLDPSPERDPFGDDEPIRGFFEHAHYLEGQSPEEPSANDTSSETPDPFRQMAGAPGATELTPPEPATPLVPLPPRKPDAYEAFSEAFTSSLRAHVLNGTPFVALALRVERNREVPFEAVAQGVRRALGPGDYLIERPPTGRLAVLVTGRDAQAAQEVFQHLKQVLREALFSADTALRAVSAVVVPNGIPFETAEDFLAYVFDAD